MKTARKQQIVMAYVLTTRGRLPDDLDKLLRDMREMIGDVSEAEVRASIKWALRQGRTRAVGAPPAEDAAQHAQAPAIGASEPSPFPGELYCRER